MPTIHVSHSFICYYKAVCLAKKKILREENIKIFILYLHAWNIMKDIILHQKSIYMYNMFLHTTVSFIRLCLIAAAKYIALDLINKKVYLLTSFLFLSAYQIMVSSKDGETDLCKSVTSYS